MICHLLMQEELIKSEEEKLHISQALLTMQLDLNHAQGALLFLASFASSSVGVAIPLRNM